MESGSSESPVKGPGKGVVRLEATVHSGDQRLAPERVADLGLDRVPDPQGGVRLLVTADEAVKLVEQGFEVHLLRALPAAPLDAALMADDTQVREWLEGRVQGIRRQGQE